MAIDLIVLAVSVLMAGFFARLALFPAAAAVDGGAQVPRAPVAEPLPRRRPAGTKGRGRQETSLRRSNVRVPAPRLSEGAAALAAGVTAGLLGARRAEAGDPSFMNNVPDPLLSRQGAADLQVRTGKVERGR